MKSIEILVSDELSDDVPLDRDRLRAYAGRVLGMHDLAAFEINIVFVGDDLMSRLNEEYRGRTGATDVLSFRLNDGESETLEGEVYVCVPQMRAQAREYGVTAEDEAVRLVTHGLLHLAGMTHDTDAGYSAMIRETEALVAEWFGAEENS